MRTGSVLSLPSTLVKLALVQMRHKSLSSHSMRQTFRTKESPGRRGDGPSSTPQPPPTPQGKLCPLGHLVLPTGGGGLSVPRLIRTDERRGGTGAVGRGGADGTLLSGELV